MKIKIDRSVGFCFLFFCVFFTPPIFSVAISLTWADTVLDYFRIVIFLLFLITVIHSKGRTISLSLISIIISFWLPQIVLTALNHGNLTSAVWGFVCMCTVCCLCRRYILANESKFLNCATAYFTLLCILNLISQILFPNGILSSQTMYGSEWGIWILGGENNMVSFVLPSMVLQCVQYVRTAMKRYLIYAALSVTTLVVGGSATGVIGASIFMGVAFFSLLGGNRLSRILNMNSYVMVAIVVFLLFVVVGSFEMFEVIIVGILGKDMTLTTRLQVWDRVIPLILENPIWGHGVQHANILRSLIGASHQHNQYLNILYQGGLASFMSFALALNACRKKLTINKSETKSYVISAGIFAFLIMFISEVYQFMLFLPFCMVLILAYYSTYEKQ